MTEAIHITDMYISGKFLPWKITYLLNSMRKIFVCCYNDFEFKVYILHFAYAIHGTHHNLVNKCDIKIVRILLHGCTLKNTVIFLLVSKNGNLISYRIIFSHPELSLNVHVKYLKDRMQIANSQLFRTDHLVCK